MTRSLSLFLVAALASSSTGCFTARYLGGQGAGALHLVTSRRKVSDVIADPETPELLRERLRLAMEARRFGIEQLGLRGGAEFTCYVDTHGPVAWNLTVAHRDRLEALTWTFPLVGNVPYLGFFDRASADREARRLEAEGYDTYVRPVGGFSSLGYMQSPIFSAMIDSPGPLGEVRTVETVLHEMAHTTAWIGSATDLNESFATVVGDRGAALFFLGRGGSGDGSEARALEKMKRLAADEAALRADELGAWLDGAYRGLDALYRRASSDRTTPAELERRRAEEFARIAASYRAAFPGARKSGLADGKINNAVLISLRVYYPGPPPAASAHRRGSDGGSDSRSGSKRIQEQLLSSVSGDLRGFIGLYREAKERSDAAGWLRGWALQWSSTHGRPPRAREAQARVE